MAQAVCWREADYLIPEYLERIFIMLLHISHDNYVRAELIAAVLRPDSSPVKRLRKNAEEKGRLIDATSGNILWRTGVRKSKLIPVRLLQLPQHFSKAACMLGITIIFLFVLTFLPGKLSGNISLKSATPS